MRLRRFLRVVVAFGVVHVLVTLPLHSASATTPPTTSPPTSSPPTSGPTTSNTSTTKPPTTNPTAGTAAPTSERQIPCDDLSQQVTALLVYGLSFTDGSPMVDAVVTLDQSVTAASLLPSGASVHSQVVVVPCDLTATVEPQGGNAEVSPSGPQFATLGPTDPARFHWILSESGDTVSLQLADLNGVAFVTRNIAVPILAFTCFRDPCGSEVSASPTTLPARPVIVPPNPVGPVITATTPDTVPRHPSTSTEVASEAPNPAGQSPSINTPATAALAQCAQHVTDILNARIVYEPKSTMHVGESNPVEAVITLDLETAPAIVFGDSNATVTADAVLLPCRIEAKLDGLASDFEISPTDFDERELSPGKDARWVWNVKPLQIRDNLPLTLLVRGKVSDGQTTSATAFKKTIVVTALSNIAKAESGLPSGLLAGIALTGVVGAGAAWQIRRRSRATHATLSGAAAGVAGAASNGASVFVSYSRKDSDRAAEIVRNLESAGYEVWRDTDDIRGGETWRRSITHGITTARLVMLLVSPNSLASENVERELSIAQDQHKRILPVSITPATISDGFQYLLAGVQILDLNGLPPVERNRVLLQAVGAILPLPALASPTSGLGPA